MADRAMSPASPCFLRTMRIIKINEISAGFQSTTTRHIKSTRGCRSMGVTIIEHKIRKGVPAAFQVSARPSLQAAAANPLRAMPPASLHGEQFAEVVLVRRGQTDWNVSGIVQGRMDQELNDVGRRQAAMLVIDRALTERHMGLFQGCPIDDCKKSGPFKVFIRGGRDTELPGGGESLNQLSERCIPRLNAIAEKHKGHERVVVVSHEAVIKEICWHADPTSLARSKFPNTSISIVHISGSDGRWILEKLGGVEHLTRDGFPRSNASSL